MMNLFRIFLLISILVISSCSKKTKEKVSQITQNELELQMIETYKEGVKSLEEGDVFFATKKFNEVELLFPQSKWAPRSILMAAYAYYTQDYYDDTIRELKRFIELYPKSTSIDYAHYLLAISYYENIIDEKKDLAPLLKSQELFQFITKKYPDTDYALDARFKLDLIRDILAAKEMYIGRHYLKKSKWIAAINRFKTVVKDYEESIYIEEALHRLVEVHYKIGLEDEARKYASVLGYNYLSGEWYKESFRIFNKNYKLITKKKKKKGAKKLRIRLKKFFK